MRQTFLARLCPRVVGVALAAVLVASCQTTSTGRTTSAPAAPMPTAAATAPSAAQSATAAPAPTAAPANPTAAPAIRTVAPAMAAGDGAAALRTAIRDVAKATRPGVVQITNQQQIQPSQFNQPFTVPAGVGSGVIYDQQGHILTNNHVVEGAQQLLVSLPDGRSFPGKLIGADPQTDLAVIQITGDNLPVVPLGDSSQLAGRRLGRGDRECAGAAGRADRERGGRERAGSYGSGAWQLE